MDVDLQNERRKQNSNEMSLNSCSVYKLTNYLNNVVRADVDADADVDVTDIQPLPPY